MKNKISYINSWNSFSKSLFLKEDINNDCFLFIVENSKDVENYSKIFDFIKLNFRVINNYEALNDLVFNKIQKAKELSWKSTLYITSLDILNNIEHKKIQLEHFSVNLEKNKTYNFNELTKKLIDLNFKFSEYKNAWTFSKNWDIFSITTADSKNKYEISFWWETIEEIRKNWELIDKINIWKNSPILISPLKREITIEWWNEKNLNIFFEIIDPNTFVLLDNLNFSKYYEELTNKIGNFSSFDYIANKSLKIIDLEINSPKIDNTWELKSYLEKNNKLIVKIYTKNTKVIKNFLEYNNIENIKIIETELNILKSFEQKNKRTYICDDIISKVFTKKRLKKNLSADLDLLLKIKPWDYVVHIEHWIGIFEKIIKKEIPYKNKKITKEYIEISYAWEDKLFVPITEVSRVNKYVWVENPKLTGLWWITWEKKLQKAKQEAEVIAEELIDIYAKRKIQKWFSFIWDLEKERFFRNNFEYTYTEDQQKAIEDVLANMEKENPMDRLVVWDVWFGKTEIAFNAIYRSFLNKKQSILIVPLVVLAYEHYEKAKDRFKKFSLKIWILTRLETEKKASETIRKLASGELDLVIWTHKLLSDKITFKDLWLIITDEEHKFWVSDKEKIKEFKTNIDSLAMSATPIPRSLNMALSSLREISILKTPPYWRQNIETLINRFSDSIIEEAWTKEFERNGQMFFIHNRVSNIENIAKTLQNIFPDKKIVIAHGQLAWIELEKRIIAFKNKKFDILLSTTVIENWIDFPNVNTIIINNADNFWLSQIHQLRWRVWRSNKKWYCHLLYRQETIKSDTAKRLKTIAEYSYVWAWFELAIKDLEIRWGWDLLGFRQSGQSSSIWINLYLKIIEEKILELQKSPHSISSKGKEVDTKSLNKIETKIDLDLDLFIKDDFFSSELDKINFYREIELIKDLEELKEVKNSFLEINNIDEIQGFKNLFDLLELKIIAERFKIISIKKVWINYQINFDKNINLEELKEFLDLDKELKFIVKSKNELRSLTKNFENNKNFVEYILSLLKGKTLNKKIKLKLWKK